MVVTRMMNIYQRIDLDMLDDDSLDDSVSAILLKHNISRQLLAYLVIISTDSCVDATG